MFVYGSAWFSSLCGLSPGWRNRREMLTLRKWERRKRRGVILRQGKASEKGRRGSFNPKFESEAADVSLFRSAELAATTTMRLLLGACQKKVPISRFWLFLQLFLLCSQKWRQPTLEFILSPQKK